MIIIIILTIKNGKSARSVEKKMERRRTKFVTRKLVESIHLQLKFILFHMKDSWIKPFNYYFGQIAMPSRIDSVC